jgi:uncharacterized membrane protein
MSTPRLDLGRPRDLGDLVAAALELYTRYFTVFAAIALAVVVPVELVVDGLGAGQLWSGYDASPPVGEAAISTFVQILVITPLITAMQVVAVRDVGAGRAPAVRRSMQAGAEVFGAVVLVVALYTAGIFLGLLALIVPGVYLGVRWYVSPQAVVIDGERGAGALRRSARLVEGKWWRVFGIVLVFNLMAGLCAALIGVPVGLLAAAADSGAVDLIGGMVVDVVVLPFIALSATLLFFDLRARHEASQRPSWAGTPGGGGELERPELPPGVAAPPAAPAGAGSGPEAPEGPERSP